MAFEPPASTLPPIPQVDTEHAIWPRDYAHTHNEAPHEAQMRSRTVRKGIDASEVVLYPWHGLNTVRKTVPIHRELGLSCSSRSSVDRRRTPRRINHINLYLTKATGVFYCTRTSGRLKTSAPWYRQECSEILQPLTKHAGRPRKYVLIRCKPKLYRLKRFARSLSDV